MSDIRSRHETSETSPDEIKEAARRILAEEAGIPSTPSLGLSLKFSLKPGVPPLAGFAARGVLLGAQPYIAKLGTPGKITAAVLPFAAAGLANDLVSDYKLGNRDQMLDGALLYTVPLYGWTMLKKLK